MPAEIIEIKQLTEKVMGLLADHLSVGLSPGL